MPRRKRQPKLTATQRRLRLERQLSLVYWLNHEFGFKDNADMLRQCKGSEGVRGGKSLVYHALQSRKHLIPVAKLDAYEGNIQRHLERINRRRQTPIMLKYFQQLAALGAEHYLSCLRESRGNLLAQLNEFVRSVNVRERRASFETFVNYTADDLKKIAFWMATGSGKTLLLHLNYLQFLHYFPNQADNILLVTPNEGLSEQHLQELSMSGIAARRVGEAADVLSSANPVQVVEITKLVEKRRGRKGVSIPLERFEGSNLLFVDEGHKGSGGEAWFSAREQLGENGFTFEYSATFGQALFAAGGDQLTEQYGKNILFDYSYRYFHDDGFGKDFSVLNLAQDPMGARMDLLMTGNLLSFYQQIAYFEERRDALRGYHLEKPLLLMLGSTVTKGTEKTASDVAELVGFVHRFAQNKHGRAVKNLQAVLDGESGLTNDAGEDVFCGKFSYIAGRDAEAVYRDILKRVFHAEAGGALFLCPLKRAVGKSEGAEIIQLFGRGVRLRGRNLSLKRSAALEGVLHPEHLHLLETLNIFAVRADFIASFRVYLEREGVDNHEIVLGIDIEREFLRQKLLIPKINGEFTDAVALAPDKNIQVMVDFSERVQTMQSAGGRVTVAQLPQNEARAWSERELDYLDWEDLYLRLLEHKRVRGWDNLLVRQSELRGILKQRVKIKTPAEHGAGFFERAQQLGDIAIAGLQKYTDRLHHARRMRWQTENMSIEALDDAHGNFKDYIVQIPRDQKELIARIEEHLQQANWAHDWRTVDLPNVHFDRHLFQPLLCSGGADVTLIPTGLAESERKFVACLRDYCCDNPEKLEGLELFLLRNLPHRGVGFPDEGGDNFYPDFILWVKRGDEQRVVFVEPHGMRHEFHPDENRKIKLHQWLAEISSEPSHRYPQQVEFESFMVSETNAGTLARQWNMEKESMTRDHNVLFMDEGDAMAQTLIKGKPSTGKPGRKLR